MTHPTFEIQTLSDRNDLGAVVVRLRGAADLDSIPALQLAFDSLAARRPSAVVLDLSGLGHISSAAIGQIISLWDALRAQNGALVITSPSPTVRAALDRVNLGVVIPIVAGVAAPLAALAVA